MAYQLDELNHKVKLCNCWKVLVIFWFIVSEWMVLCRSYELRVHGPKPGLADEVSRDRSIFLFLTGKWHEQSAQNRTCSVTVLYVCYGRVTQTSSRSQIIAQKARKENLEENWKINFLVILLFLHAFLRSFYEKFLQ